MTGGAVVTIFSRRSCAIWRLTHDDLVERQEASPYKRVKQWELIDFGGDAA
jgi:hypothetical protein